MEKDVLIIIQERADATQLLPKVERLTHSMGNTTKINAVRVVYEGLADLKSKHVDQVHELKQYVLTAEAPLIVEAIEEAKTTDIEIDAATIWNRHSWQGALHTAESIDAGFIIKPIGRQRGAISLHTPDDWNLVRHSNVPVLLTHANSWPEQPVILAAVDIYDQAHHALNRRVLENAKQICQRLHGTLHIVSVFPLISNWLDGVTTIKSFKHLRHEIEQEMTTEVAHLCQSFGIEKYHLHVKEGLADVGIHDVSNKINSNILVIGTRARTGVSGYIIGNTAEKILYRVDTDVLAVP